jgi:hypothetical protein
VQHFVASDFVEVFDVGDFERAHCLNRRDQRVIGLAGSSPLRQLSSGSPQRSKDLRAIESLSCTMLAETHSGADLVLNITVTLVYGCGAGRDLLVAAGLKDPPLKSCVISRRV